MRREAVLLPTRARMNPSKPSSAAFYEVGLTIIVVTFREDPFAGARLKYAALTTWGDADGWEIDTEHDIVHDQTRRSLATNARVIGFAEHHGTLGANAFGALPDISMPHWVFK